MDVSISYPVIRHKTDGSLCLAIYRGDVLSSLRWPIPIWIFDNCGVEWNKKSVKKVSFLSR
jgi:hypothetical protein